jgi:hypothetical protein
MAKNQSYVEMLEINCSILQNVWERGIDDNGEDIKQGWVNEIGMKRDCKSKNPLKELFTYNCILARDSLMRTIASSCRTVIGIGELPLSLFCSRICCPEFTQHKQV